MSSMVVMSSFISVRIDEVWVAPRIRARSTCLADENEGARFHLVPFPFDALRYISDPRK